VAWAAAGSKNTLAGRVHLAAVEPLEQMPNLVVVRTKQDLPPLVT
jgi:hypothetical protein